LTASRTLPVYLDRADPKRFTIDWLGSGDVPLLQIGSAAAAL